MYSTAITEFVHQSLDKYDEVRIVALDISKAFQHDLAGWSSPQALDEYSLHPIVPNTSCTVSEILDKIQVPVI